MILDIIEQEDTRFATIVQSPGTALIGDKLKDEVLSKGLDDKTLVIDSSFMSEKFSTGFDTTLVKMAEKIVKPHTRNPRSVNIVGLPFTTRGYFAFLEELRGCLASMGVEVVAAVGAGCTLDDFGRSSSAELNICIFPEYCHGLSEFYEQRFGIPTMISDGGAPVGYFAMRRFIGLIAERLAVVPSPALSTLDRDEFLIRTAMSSSSGMATRMNYRTFSVRGESSLVYPLCDFLIRYLRMVPNQISITEHDEMFDDRIADLMQKMDCRPIDDDDFGTVFSNVIFGPGTFVRMCEDHGMCDVGIDISLPARDLIDIAPKSVMGVDGLHMLLDTILNARP